MSVEMNMIAFMFLMQMSAQGCLSTQRNLALNLPQPLKLF